MNINNLISKAALCSAALAASSLLPSCVSPKEVLYIQDVSGQTNEKIKGNYQTVIQKDDQLSITVSSKQPELAAPFAVSEIGSSSQGTSSRKGYLVDANGYIDGGSILYNGMDLTKFQTDKDWLKIRGKDCLLYTSPSPRDS